MATNEQIIDSVLARKTCQLLAEHAVRCGLVDPEGKSDDQLRLELLRCLRDEFLGNVEGFIIDHTSTLLKKARTYRTAGDHYLTALFYATWVEHWLNSLIRTIGGRRNIQDEEILQIIRDTPLRGKLTWLVTLLGLQKIADRHRKAVLQITDIRNGFVHYKWQGKPEQAMEQERAKTRQFVLEFEATVKYLLDYENRRVFARNRGRVRKLI